MDMHATDGVVLEGSTTRTNHPDDNSSDYECGDKRDHAQQQGQLLRAIDVPAPYVAHDPPKEVPA